MKKRILCTLMFLLFSILLHCNSSQANGNGEGLEVVAKNLEIPWAVDFLPDGRLIFTERPGFVRIIENDSVRTVGEIDVAAVGEAGLLGIAVDPEFEQNQFVYLYYTCSVDGGLRNRLSRFVFTTVLGNETVLLDSIPGATIHDGGRVAFGPDNLLYVTTGDAGDASLSGDTGSLAGKILRMEKDGSIPADNPFNNYIYAYGLRNSQGIAWQNGAMYATDHGPIQHDEINKIERGQDYGWPQTCDEYPALFCYPDFTLAPASAVAINNYLFVTGLRGNQIRRINLESRDEKTFYTDLGRLRPIVEHERYLYFATSNRDGRGTPGPDDDKIYRVPVDIY